MGHMDQSRKHVRSTKPDKDISNDKEQQEPNNHPTHNVFATIEEPNGTISCKFKRR